MWRKAVLRPLVLSPETQSVLEDLADHPEDTGRRINAIAQATGLAVSHVGRHLRTLEVDRLAREHGGLWSATPRGRLYVEPSIAQAS